MTEGQMSWQTPRRIQGAAEVLLHLGLLEGHPAATDLF